MTARLNAALTVAASELARIRADVTIADTGVLSANAPFYMGVKGLAYVRAAAVLEAHLKAALGAVLAELDTRQVAMSSIRLSLHSVLSDGYFESLRDQGSRKRWRTRADVLARVDNPAPVSFGLLAFALDGKTLRADHFELIWHVFGLPGPYLPAALGVYRLALEDLAERRNDLAHGQMSPIDVARMKTAPEVFRMVEQVEKITEHITLAAHDYLTQHLYRR